MSGLKTFGLHKAIRHGECGPSFQERALQCILENFGCNFGKHVLHVGCA